MHFICFKVFMLQHGTTRKHSTKCTFCAKFEILWDSTMIYVSNNVRLFKNDPYICHDPHKANMNRKHLSLPTATNKHNIDEEKLN